MRIIHRRDELRASKILQHRAFANDKIEFVWNTVVTEITGDAEGKVSGVKTKDTVTGEEGFLETDGVFIFIGHLPNNELLQGKFHLDGDGHLITDSKMRTNVPGVFAAGEIMDKVFKQVATSVGQGCAAAMQAEKFLADLEDEGFPGFEDPREFVRWRAWSSSGIAKTQNLGNGNLCRARLIGWMSGGLCYNASHAARRP